MPYALIIIVRSIILFPLNMEIEKHVGTRYHEEQSQGGTQHTTHTYTGIIHRTIRSHTV
jgi:hypothetical protein